VVPEYFRSTLEGRADWELVAESVRADVTCTRERASQLFHSLIKGDR
jgi:hypothetical protein